MHRLIPEGGGLQGFIAAVRSRREATQEVIVSAAEQADRVMYDSGVVACGDISNNAITFDIKRDSNIRYLTFTEVFGSDPLVAGARMSDALAVADKAGEAGLPCQITPHAVYSVSDPLSGLT